MQLSLDDGLINSIQVYNLYPRLYKSSGPVVRMCLVRIVKKNSYIPMVSGTIVYPHPWCTIFHTHILIFLRFLHTNFFHLNDGLNYFRSIILGSHSLEMLFFSHSQSFCQSFRIIGASFAYIVYR